MSKSLLAAKIVGGGVLGTGTAVAGGIYIDKYIKSKDVSDQTIEPVSSTPEGSGSIGQADSAGIPNSVGNSDTSGRDNANLTQESSPAQPPKTVDVASEKGTDPAPKET